MPPPAARPVAPGMPPAAAQPRPAAPAAPTRPAAPAPAPGAAPVRRDPFGFGVGAPAKASVAPPPKAEEDFGDIDVEAPPPAAPRAPAAPEISFDADFEEPAKAPAPIELPEEEDAGTPELAPMHAFVPPPAAVGHKPEAAPRAASDGGEALLREALSKASLEVIEKVVWEVVPQLAETIIRENLEKLVKRQG
jgi:hypothetical protein